MIWLGALGTLLLYILQLVGVIPAAVSIWVILAPLLIGAALSLLWFLLVLLIEAISNW